MLRGSRILRPIPLLCSALAMSAAAAAPAAAASLKLLFPAVEYRDLDGDQDRFPDPGETGRLAFTVTNPGPALGPVSFILVSADPNIVCMPDAIVTIPAIGAGATIVVGSLGASGPGFTITVSATLQSVLPGNPAHITLSLMAVSEETTRWSGTLPMPLPGDIDVPPGTTFTPTPGPDGTPGTADDGKILENFDVDRDGDGRFTVNDTFRTPDGRHGFYQRAAADPGEGVLAGLPCGGFLTPADGNASCALLPSYPMDWHLHCPPGSTTCPNVETGACVGGCSYTTPANGQRAFSLPNSLHMGAHYDPLDRAAGDTTHFRALQAFVSAPINLDLFSDLATMDLSMRHIARLMDNWGIAPGTNLSICFDCADVQVQMDENPDRQIDDWGAWDKLVPFQNVYEHMPLALSHSGSEDCQFTPSDAVAAPPPAPAGAVVETMCTGSGVWSGCGSNNGTNGANVGTCLTPGDVDPSGTGVWATTKFHLAAYAGQRIRIRWIGQSWDFGDVAATSYYELGGGWASTMIDDGWWLDDISVGGTLLSPAGVTSDGDPPVAPPVCPVDACNQAVDIMGSIPASQVTDTAGTPLDLSANVPEEGQSIRYDASASILTGGCAGGVPEYRFFRDGASLGDWGTSPFLDDVPRLLTAYEVGVRCSTDHTCTTPGDAPRIVPTRTTDGGDGFLGEPSEDGPVTITGISYSRTTQRTSLRLWTSSSNLAVDLYRVLLGTGTGVGAPGPGPGWIVGAGAAPGFEPVCLRANLPPLARPAGGLRAEVLTQADDPNPAPGQATMYFFTHDAPDGSSVNAMGCASPGVCRLNAGKLCAKDADCAGAGACLNTALSSDTPPGPFECPFDGDPRKVLRRVPAASLCQ